MSEDHQKVKPIRGRYETIQAMAAHIMGDEKAKSGLIIYFGKDGCVNVGEIGLTAEQMALILLEVTQRAVSFQW